MVGVFTFINKIKYYEVINTNDGPSWIHDDRFINGIIICLGLG